MMKPSTLVAALSLLSGCGVHVYDPAPRGSGGTYQPGPSQPAPSIPAYLIDAGVGVDLPELAYAVTTNGLDWTLAWTGDAAFREFEGEVIGAGRISSVRFSGGFVGDRVDQVEAGRVQFRAATDGGVIQSVTLRSDTQPVRFSLFIDGAPAVDGVVFSSSGQLSTTEAVPFDLLTEDQIRARGTRVTHAKPVAQAAQALRSGAHTRHIPAPGAADSSDSR